MTRQDGRWCEFEEFSEFGDWGEIGGGGVMFNGDAYTIVGALEWRACWLVKREVSNMKVLLGVINE